MKWKSGTLIFSCPSSSRPTLVNQSLHWLFRSLLWIQSLPDFQGEFEPRKTDGGHEETWPDQQKDNDKDKDNDNDI